MLITLWMEIFQWLKHAILFFTDKIWTSNWILCAYKNGHFLSYFQSIISVICIRLHVCCHYSLRPGIWCVGGVKTLKDLEKHSTITKVWSRCCDVGRWDQQLQWLGWKDVFIRSYGVMKYFLTKISYPGSTLPAESFQWASQAMCLDEEEMVMMIDVGFPKGHPSQT